MLARAVALVMLNGRPVCQVGHGVDLPAAEHLLRQAGEDRAERQLVVDGDGDAMADVVVGVEPFDLADIPRQRLRPLVVGQRVVGAEREPVAIPALKHQLHRVVERFEVALEHADRRDARQRASSTAAAAARVPAPIGARLMSPTTNATLSPREPTYPAATTLPANSFSTVRLNCWTRVDLKSCATPMIGAARDWRSRSPPAAAVRRRAAASARRRRSCRRSSPARRRSTNGAFFMNDCDM